MSPNEEAFIVMGLRPVPFLLEAKNASLFYPSLPFSPSRSNGPVLFPQSTNANNGPFFWLPLFSQSLHPAQKPPHPPHPPFPPRSSVPLSFPLSRSQTQPIRSDFCGGGGEGEKRRRPRSRDRGETKFPFCIKGAQSRTKNRGGRKRERRERERGYASRTETTDQLFKDGWTSFLLSFLPCRQISSPRKLAAATLPLPPPPFPFLGHCFEEGRKGEPPPPASLSLSFSTVVVLASFFLA